MLSGDLPPSSSQLQWAGLGCLFLPAEGFIYRIFGCTSKWVLTLINFPIGMGT